MNRILDYHRDDKGRFYVRDIAGKVRPATAVESRWIERLASDLVTPLAPAEA